MDYNKMIALIPIVVGVGAYVYYTRLIPITVCIVSKGGDKHKEMIKKCSLRPVEMYYRYADDNHEHPERQASSRMDQAEELAGENAEIAMGISDDETYVYALVDQKLIYKETNDSKTLEEKIIKIILKE